jgi:hypothetical protein
MVGRAIGNNDAHAKNVALLHLSKGTQLTEIYDAVPNLFQEGRIDWNLALSAEVRLTGHAREDRMERPPTPIGYRDQ